MDQFVIDLKKIMDAHGIELSMVDASSLNAMFVCYATEEDFDIRNLLADEYKERLTNLIKNPSV